MRFIAICASRRFARAMDSEEALPESEEAFTPGPVVLQVRILPEEAVEPELLAEVPGDRHQPPDFHIPVPSSASSATTVSIEAADVEEHESSENHWNGHVAMERWDGTRTPLIGFHISCPSSKRSASSEIPGKEKARAWPLKHSADMAKRNLRNAMGAIESCSQRLQAELYTSAGRGRNNCSAEVAVKRNELNEVRSEARLLHRELQRLRAASKELNGLSLADVFALQRELATALRNVQSELESRTKCCICREMERKVLLRPCQHFALCTDCVTRVDRCPLCRTTIDVFEAVCIA